MGPARSSFYASIATAAFLTVLPSGSAHAQDSTGAASPSGAPPPAAPPSADAVQVVIEPPLVDASNAHPQAPTPPPAIEEAKPEQPRLNRSHWYGWQTLSLDGLALATLWVGKSETAAKGAIAIYALGPMIVHIAHGRPGVGIADMVLRVGAPTVLGLAMFALGSTADKGSDAGFPIAAALGAIVGVFAGCALSISLDAAVFTRERVPPKKTGVSWAPTVAPQKGGATFGLVGAF